MCPIFKKLFMDPFVNRTTLNFIAVLNALENHSNNCDKRHPPLLPVIHTDVAEGLANSLTMASMPSPKVLKTG
jgi:hypothetical protein